MLLHLKTSGAVKCPVAPPPWLRAWYQPFNFVFILYQPLISFVRKILYLHSINSYLKVLYFYRIDHSFTLYQRDSI